MEKKILFVEEKESFISRAICENLKQNGFEVENAKADISAISKLSKIPDLIFINLEDSVKDNSELLVYLKDKCVEDDKLLFFTGYGADIEEVVSKMPDQIVGLKFERPVNTKEVGAKVAKKLETEGEELAKRHILVVDDSGTFLRTIKGMLSGRYRVSMVNSAANAITFLATNKPDLILLDYEMPVCDGPQLLQMIRSESATSQIPVIFLTGKDDKESVQKVLALKPQGYLLKTLPPEKIIESVDKFFAMLKAKE